MPIKKQEFYEGAALYLLARTGRILSICYEQPFFIVNDRLTLYLKYSTQVRSPWGYTFAPNEQKQLYERSIRSTVIIGLVCGNDGVACLPFCNYKRIASNRQSSVHISCYRKHGMHYEINGPDGRLPLKVSPSDWQKILV